MSQEAKYSVALPRLNDSLSNVRPDDLGDKSLKE